MAVSQKNTNSVDLLAQIVDLDELLRLLCGAADEDVCMRGLTVSLTQAKQLAGQVRECMQLVVEQADKNNSTRNEMK